MPYHTKKRDKKLGGGTMNQRVSRGHGSKGAERKTANMGRLMYNEGGSMYKDGEMPIAKPN